MVPFSRAAAQQEEQRLARTSRYQQAAMTRAGSVSRERASDGGSPIGAWDGSTRTETPASFVRAADMIPLVGGNDYAIYFWSEMARIDAESEARGTQPGGVRDLDLVQQLPDAPAAGWFFNLVDSFILWSVGAAYASGGSTMWDDIWSFGGDAADAGAAVVDYGADPVWNWVDAGSGAMDAGAAAADVAAAGGDSWFQVPQWLQDAGSATVDFGGDLARRAVQQFVEQEIREEFGPGATRAPVVQPRALPQQNLAPVSGLPGFIYPFSGSGSSRSYVPSSGGGYNYSGGGFSGGAVAGGGGGGGGMSISPNLILALIAGIMVMIFGVAISRR